MSLIRKGEKSRAKMKFLEMALFVCEAFCIFMLYAQNDETMILSPFLFVTHKFSRQETSCLKLFFN